jgi:predicted enzyme related to lactoylglutathione lyase
MSYLPGKVVWFEHVSNDIAKARNFYEPLFGWHTESMPMGEQRYPMILNRQVAIGGYSTAPPGQRSGWMCYLSVPDVDAAHRSALTAGARSLMPPTDFGPVGRGSTIADPTGAALSLWKSAEGDRADTSPAAVGDWTWNELWTSDEQMAIAFYERVFGYTHQSMDMGAQRTYHVLKKDGVSRAGVMRSTEPKVPSMWLPYVAVDDCDAASAKVKALGAQVVHGPADIPGVGRFAVLVDPVGAALAIIKPEPGAM